MHPVILTSAKHEALLGRLVPPAAGRGDFQTPARVKLGQSTEETSTGIHNDGSTRKGIPADVKPGLHWLLVPLEAGGYALRPISGWVEFGHPSHAPDHVASKHVDAAETELRQAANVRKEHVERWEGMLARREQRTGSVVPGREALLELRTVNSSEEVKESKPVVLYPEESRINDESGLKKQKQKAKKALKKEAMSKEKAEDDEVPETANALLMLKSERGEGTWDFEGGALYSDDEADNSDFEEQLQHTQETEMQPMDEEDGENVELGTALTKVGREIEALIEKYGDGKTQGEDDAQSGASDDILECQSGDGSRKRRRVQQPKPETAVATPPAHTTGRRTSQKHADKEVALVSKASAGRPTDMELRERIIDCLRKGNGTCTLSEVSVVLGLQDKESELYKRAVPLMKEVGEVRRVAGEKRALLVLKPGY